MDTDVDSSYEMVAVAHEEIDTMLNDPSVRSSLRYS